MLASAGGKAAEPLRVYGPGGPLPAMQEAAAAFGRTGGIDGLNEFTIWWKIAMPLVTPALSALAIFTFLGAWDEFVWAVTIIDSKDNRTLPMAIQLFQGQHGTSWGLVFAASTIAVVPVIAVFVVFQRYFVSGLAAHPTDPSQCPHSRAPAQWSHGNSTSTLEPRPVGRPRGDGGRGGRRVHPPLGARVDRHP